jgi:hypothetical protein
MAMTARLVDVRRSLLVGISLVVFATLTLAAFGPARAAALSTPNTALINGESITNSEEIPILKEGTPISLEQYAAEAAGFKVTIVSGSQWKAMTAAEFAQYQVLIVGDPNCSETAPSAVESVGTWAPVVMGKAGLGEVVGNRTVVGTDPEDHFQYGDNHASPREEGNPSTAGAEHLVQDGIAFAGAVSGATGAYFDTSCSAPSNIGEVLDQISTGPGHWEEGQRPSCGNAVSLIATNSAFTTPPTTLINEDIQGWECSAHVSFQAFPADWHALALTLPEGGSAPVCGNDIETKEFHCGNAYVLVAGGGVVAENPFIKLEPTTGSSVVGGTHTVIATVNEEEPAEAPAPSRLAGLIPGAGKVVGFAVTGQNGGVTGTCTTGGGTPDPECKTDASGKVEFTYPDTHGAGADTINASVVLQERLQTTTASWTWTPVPVVTTTPPAPAPAPPAKTEVLAFGSAKLASSKACVAASGYTARVSGKAISSVTFTLDGHKLKTLTKPNSHGTFSLHIGVRSGKAHHLSIHVVFTSASHTKPVTLHKTLARCAARTVKPRFTG